MKRFALIAMFFALPAILTSAPLMGQQDIFKSGFEESEPPPDPETLAPELDPGVATLLCDASKFLYTGVPRIQIGADGSNFVCERVAVLRGQVFDRQGDALAGVSITIVGHDEYGFTLTRNDGMFDLVVNGGDRLTVNYQRSGFLLAQRTLQVPWEAHVRLPEVVMIPQDSRVTSVDLASPGMKVAQSTRVNDVDGARQSTLLIPQGVAAELVLRDGSKQTVTALNIRATEYTVGDSGDEAMPAELPPNSAYTYAFELSADEAVAKVDGKDVMFSEPVYYYVENFLDAEVGSLVPVGYYDPDKALWRTSQSGRVVKIVGINAGLADLDTDGDGLADDAATLAELGLTEAERTELASLYAVDQTLWRIPMTHFSTWDANWGWGPPDDAAWPDQSNPDDYDPLRDPCEQGGFSVIECQNQTLGENVGVVGTPYDLHYQSDRVVGNRTANTLTIHLSGAAVPASLTRIEVTVTVAGRSFSHRIGDDDLICGGATLQQYLGGRKRTGKGTADLTNQTYVFNWDGQDAYGRQLQGQQRTNVRIGYVYCGGYQQTDQFGYNGRGMIEGSRTRRTVTLGQQFETVVGPWDARGLGLAGWSLNVHHAYDALGQVLYLGDGRRRSAVAQGPVIRTVAGTGAAGFSGDGGPATEATLNIPIGLTAGADGTVYFSDFHNQRVRKISTDGIISTVAGNGTPGFRGDGGPAAEALLANPEGLAIAPDGSLYIADRGNHRIRQVRLDGTIMTVAGGGAAGGTGGDGGPATEGYLFDPLRVAVGLDGSLYIAEYNYCRVRRVAPDGIISTVAGTGTCGYTGSGDLATTAQIGLPRGLAVGGDGSLYLAEYAYARIRRVTPDGIISDFAGTGTRGFSGDGGPASQAQISGPAGVSIDRNGHLLIAELFNNRVRQITSDAMIDTVVGSGLPDYSGDGGPATAADIDHPQNAVASFDGSIYLTDGSNHRIRKVSPSLPGHSPSDVLIASEDGEELFVFDRQGRHKQTLHSLTGATLYMFNYDANSQLASVEDASGNITALEREPDGELEAIVSPYGQQTSVSVDSNGYLASITNPASETITFSYSSDGLLESVTDATNATFTYGHDAQGRLESASDPSGGSESFARTSLVDGYQVTRTTALGRTSTYTVQKSATGDLNLTTTFANGTQSNYAVSKSREVVLNLSDGTLVVAQEAADARLGMQTPTLSSATVSSPGGVSYTQTTTQSVDLDNPDDPLSMRSMTNVTGVNGRDYTDVYDATTRKLTSTSPEGRQLTITRDSIGRVTEYGVAGSGLLGATYDLRGRISVITDGTVASQRVVQLTYDTEGNVASIVDPLGRSTTYVRDLAGRTVARELADGAIERYAYNANGNLASVTPPGRMDHQFAFTDTGLLEAYTLPDIGLGTSTISYEYNVDRQLARIDRPDGESLSINYFSTGDLQRVEMPTGNVDFTYDPDTGHVSTISTPDSVSLAYTFDGPLLTQQAWSGPITGTVAFTYSDNRQLAGIAVNGGETVGYHYDDDSLVVQAGVFAVTRHPTEAWIDSATLGTVTETLNYNDFGELTGRSVTVDGPEVFSEALTRDTGGYVTTNSEYIDGESHNYAYGYDLAGRVDRVTTDGVTDTYSYDDNGNRVALNGLTGVYDGRDRLQQYGPTSYVYSDDGELLTETTAAQSTMYTYDALDNLISVVLPDATRIDYLHDGRLRRVGKRVDGQLVQGLLYLNGINPVAELAGDGSVVSLFVYGTRSNIPDYMVKDGNTYRIVADDNGSPRLVIDVVTGYIVQRLDYDAFGIVKLDTNPGFQPFGFAGGIYDLHTQKVRLGAREYDPVTGRWMSFDTTLFTSGQTNLYAYVNSDPVNGLDFTGNDNTKVKVPQVVKDLATEAGQKEAEAALAKPIKPASLGPKPNPKVAPQIPGASKSTGDFYKWLERANLKRPAKCSWGYHINVGYFLNLWCEKFPTTLVCPNSRAKRLGIDYPVM